MTYQLRNVLNPSEVIAESDNMIDLWEVADKQHFLLLPSLVVTKGDEIVAAEESLVSKMRKAKIHNVYKILEII